MDSRSFPTSPIDLSAAGVTILRVATNLPFEGIVPLSRFAVILAAAGRSSRFGNPHTKKVYASLAGGKPLWLLAAEPFCKRPDVAQVILVIAQEDRQLFQEKFSASAALLGIEVVLGGAQRADSVLNGLRQVRPDIAWVAIHDAARPCIDPASIDAVFAAATSPESLIAPPIKSLESLIAPPIKSPAPLTTASPSSQLPDLINSDGAIRSPRLGESSDDQAPQELKTLAGAILAVPCHATLKRATREQTIEQTLSRERVWLAQTPQVFRTHLLRDAYERHPDPASATDDAAIIEASGYSVRLVEGSPLNIKVTTQADMKFAELAMQARPNPKLSLFD